MKILIIGASSYLGARLYIDLKKDFDVVGTYSSNKLFPELEKLDLTSKEKIDNVISNVKPDVIVHCANLPNSEAINVDPGKGKLINLDSSNIIVESANKIKAKVIFISSFAAIVQEDIYGQYKFQSEEKVKKTVKGWLILRPAYIIGLSPNTINDRLYNRLLKKIKENKPVVCDNSWKTPVTYIGYISEIIKLCIEKNIWNEILPLSTIVKKSRYEIAVDILNEFGIKVTKVDKKDFFSDKMIKYLILKKLGLPKYSYREIIKKVINETKNYFQSGL